MEVPSLRLYLGPDHPPVPGQPYTLPQAFEEITLPLLQRRGRAPATIGKYEKAVWYWEQLHPRDPPITEITHDDLDALPAALLQPSRQFAINTHTEANQQLMYIEAILRSCGPRVGRRGGAGLLQDVPIGDRLPPQAPTRRRRVLPEEAWNLLYLACGRLRTPRSWRRRLSFPLASRAMLVLLYNCGPRRAEAMTMPLSAVVRTVEHPDDEVDAESPHGWLSYHTPKTRAKKNGLPLVVPISACLRRHLDAIEGALPYGEHGRTWGDWLSAINRHAGIDPHYTFQDMRKSANRALRRVGGREVAAFILGHQPRGVNASWYDDLTEDAVEAVGRLPQPEVFERGPEC